MAAPNNNSRLLGVKSNPSLLLQPAASGFTLNQMAGNTLLMPVSHKEPQIDSKVVGSNTNETDSFVGQVQENNPSSGEANNFQYFNPSNNVASNLPSFPTENRDQVYQNTAYNTSSFTNTPKDTPSPFMTPQSSNQFSMGTPAPVPYQNQIQHFSQLTGDQSASLLHHQPISTNIAGPPPQGFSQNYRRVSGGSKYLPPPGLQLSAPSQLPSFADPSTADQQSSFSGFKDNYSSPMLQEEPNIVTHDLGAVNLQSDNNYVQPNVDQNLVAPPPQSYQGSPLPVFLTNAYRPVTQHWFYKKNIESRDVWTPFSLLDSLSLEEAYISGIDVVPTNGGRYDVTLSTHSRSSVYWQEDNQASVRRCSWFYKGEGERFVPYEEGQSLQLEEAYKEAVTSNTWPKNITIDDNVITMHNPQIIVCNQSVRHKDQWGSVSEIKIHPRSVRRGVDDFDNVDDGEPAQIDHLVFVIHGIGAFSDLKFRDIIECVDDFRSISLMLMQSHFGNAQSDGLAGRVEFIPVKWHGTLHGDTTGIDKNLEPITLTSIPKLRHFANDTVLDVLFYTSPIYCQTIIDTVCTEVNRLYILFKGRNPHFDGGTSVIGHSLGSLIVFDLLANQQAEKVPDVEKTHDLNLEKANTEESIASNNLSTETSSVTSVNYSTFGKGTGLLTVSYPKFDFSPSCFFAIGSPVPMFLTVRGVQSHYTEDFKLPTCPGFFNIFHPFDPVAYRMEPIINRKVLIDPILVPHHKGRKRLHLELKDSIAKYGSDIKQKVVESIKSTLNSVYEFARFHQPEELGDEIGEVADEEINKQNDQNVSDAQSSDAESVVPDVSMGSLNGGRRIDYVLQEKPIESINQYLFALASHTCYWESEDTVLFMLTEIYALKNIEPKFNPKPEPKFQLYNPAAVASASSRPPNYMPSPFSNTAPPAANLEVFQPPSTTPIIESTTNTPDVPPTFSGPPPLSGFVRSSQPKF